VIYIKIWINLLFLIFFIQVVSPAWSSDDKLVIIAPMESASAAFDYQFIPVMAIKGWVCGTNGSSVHLKTVEYIFQIKTAEQAFRAATAAIESHYAARNKAIKPPAKFKGLSIQEVTATINDALQRFPADIRFYNNQINSRKKELEIPLKGTPENFFGVNLEERALHENYLDDNFHIDTWQDDGAYQIWTTTDCYTGAELRTMQHAIGQALDAASAARDTFLKTTTRVHDGKGPSFTL